MNKSRTLVFIVDDDPAFTEMLTEHLQSNLEIEIRSFDTGEDCLSHLDDGPDLVILDHMLNLIQKDAADGLYILDRIKAVQPDLRVIMLSGQDSYGTALKTITHGAMDYVVKDEHAFERVDSLVKSLP